MNVSEKCLCTFFPAKRTSMIYCVCVFFAWAYLCEFKLSFLRTPPSAPFLYDVHQDSRGQSSHIDIVVGGPWECIFRRRRRRCANLRSRKTTQKRQRKQQNIHKGLRRTTDSNSNNRQQEHNSTISRWKLVGCGSYSLSG